MSATRDQVMARLVDYMAQAKAEGRDGYASARETFGNVPEIVLAEAWTYAEMEDTENWWRNIERTIDGEIIGRAIAQNLKRG